MSPPIIGIFGFVAFFILALIGVPIGFAMLLVGFGGISFLAGSPAAALEMAMGPFRYATTYEYSVLALFLFMAYVLSASGIAGDLYHLSSKWLGRLPGGLAMASIAGCAIFSAASASSIATASAMGSIAVPEMKKYKYDPALATGSVAAGGTMGILIPPSGQFIFYGILTGTSIGRLFMAGIVPGILEAAFYVVAIFISCKRNPGYGPPGPRFSLREKVAAFGSCGEIVVLIGLVLGGIYVGWFTPTEAGAVGAAGAIIVSFARRRLTVKGLRQPLRDARGIGMIYLILVGALVFGKFIALSRLPYVTVDLVTGLNLPHMATLAIILVMYLILGAIMDVAAMMAITLPIFFPLALALGFNPIWFGVITTRMMEIGMVTPPIGINTFVIAGTSGESLGTVFRGVIPFLLADFCHVIMLVLIPAIALFLPNMMMGT